MREVEDRFGHEGPSDTRSIMGWPAPPMADRHKPVQLQQRQSTNEQLVTFTHWPQFIPDCRKQLVLQDGSERLR